MANKRLFQFLYSKQPKLTMIQGAFQIGASGTVASGGISGAGVYQVTKLATGVYQIKLADNYANVLDANFCMGTGISATEVAVASLVASTTYQIAVVGNSTWSTVGVDSQYTPIVGSPFVATNVAGSGTGTAKAIVASGIDTIETVRNLNGLLTNASPNQGLGTSIIFQTLANQSSGGLAMTTMVPTNAVASSTCHFKIWFKDSSVQAL